MESAKADLADGETHEMKGSAAKPYLLKNTGGVYSCTCPAWRNQGVAIERRTCKHLRAFRGDAAETARVGTSAAPARTASAARAPSKGAADDEAAAEGAAPPLLLAHRWENDVDLTGWWMSEKLDGVRAYWDGSKLVSRLGNTFHAPEWFLEKLPRDMPLDGELFGGRQRFQRTVSVVRRQDKSDAWREIRYVVFDAPALEAAFEDRLRALEARVTAVAAEHVAAHPHERCRGVDHLREELARVEGLGGEGLMLRKPGSRYEVGRSSTLLKVKTFRDAEARVRRHLPGAGKHAGRLGALECELEDGTVFSCGTGLSDEERRNPPPVGAIITFRYQELSADGVPRFPSYVGVRDDVRFTPRAPERARPAPTPAPAPAPAPAAAPASRDARVFERDGQRWEISLAASAHVIRRTRGEAVETLTTSFDGGAKAWRDADRRIAEQLAEGWAEVEP